MIGKETKAKIVVAILTSSLIITNAKVMHDNSVLRKDLQNQIQQNTKTTKEMTEKQSSIQKLLDEEKKRGSDLQKYIDTNKQIMEKADSIKQRNDDLSKENEALKLYHQKTQSEVSPSRGSINNVAEKHLKVRRINVELSMYCRTDIGGEVTATGKRTEWGMIAVPPEIPLGSQIVIQGFDHTVFKATDHGGYIQKVGDVYRIDIFVETREEAMAFGRKHNMVAYIIEKGD